jgi:hypothetical protein
MPFPTCHSTTYHSAPQAICQVSRNEFEDIYKRLDVTLVEKGESFYQSRMEQQVMVSANPFGATEWRGFGRG